MLDLPTPLITAINQPTSPPQVGHQSRPTLVTASRRLLPAGVGGLTLGQGRLDWGWDGEHNAHLVVCVETVLTV